jgi:hypothetical protein
MVVNIKHIAGAFLALALLQGTLWYYFNEEIKTQSIELEQKREMISNLNKLQDKWSKKSQQNELKRVYELLNAFDVTYTLTQKRKINVIAMELQANLADKIVALLLNRNIDIKKLKITKIDKHSVKLEVEVL